MCQPKEKGGRRCPAHQPASIGMKKFMNAQYRLLPEQIEHTFKNLRAQAANHPTPTMEEYQHLISRSKIKLNNANLDEKTKRSILRQLDKELTESELPDGATFYALKKLQARTREQKREFVQAIRELARYRGTNRNEAFQAFKEKYAEIEGSFDMGDAHQFDGKTRAVLDAMMGREGVTSNGFPEFSTEPRIQHHRVNSSWITSMGYDPDDGRLEIKTSGYIFAYHNVSPELYERIQANHSELRREVFNNAAYAYENRAAADRDSVGRYCKECHKYRAISGHVCEGRPARLPSDIQDAIEGMDMQKELTYEAAVQRLQDEIARESEVKDPEPQSMPIRPREMTEQEKIWATPVEDREKTTLSGDINDDTTWTRVHLPDDDYAAMLTPKASLIKQGLDEGKVVEFQGVQRVNARVDKEALTRQDMRAYRGAGGMIIIEPVGNRRCECDAYKVNGRCEHLRPTWCRGMEEGVDAYESTEAKVIYRHVIDATRSKLLNHFDVPEFQVRRLDESYEDGLSFVSLDEDQYTNYAGVAQKKSLSEEDVRALREMLDAGVEPQVTFIELHRTGQDPYERGFSSIVTFGVKDGEYIIKDSRITRCYICRRARRPESECPHQDMANKFALATVTGQVNRGMIDYEAMSPSDRLKALSEASQNWTANESDVQEMSSFAMPTGVDRSYSANLDQYIADVREAEERIARGESAIPYTRENATGGICAPGSGRGFGIEIEYDLSPNAANSYDVQDSIARDLYEAGLSDIDHPTQYHGYRGTRWHIEDDCSVAGEVVSPILQDSPEHWEELEKVLAIVKKHGGVSSKNTGGHVHMGLGRGEAAELERRKIAATQIYSAFEDTLRRIQADPNRKKHRDNLYCKPVGDSAQDLIYELRTGYVEEDHCTSLNMGHEGRIEFRGADGSLDAAHIQAQVVTAASIVAAAERGELDESKMKNSKVGSNAMKMQLITKGKKRKLTDDELIVSDIELRRFADDILGTEHGRKIMAGIAANTPWQETKR